MEICKHWKELDGDAGGFEFCRATLRKVGCCGTKSQCFYNEKYERKERPDETIKDKKENSNDYSCI